MHSIPLRHTCRAGQQTAQQQQGGHALLECPRKGPDPRLRRKPGPCPLRTGRKGSRYGDTHMTAAAPSGTRREAPQTPPAAPPGPRQGRPGKIPGLGGPAGGWRAGIFHHFLLSFPRFWGNKKAGMADWSYCFVSSPLSNR